MWRLACQRFGSSVRIIGWGVLVSSSSYIYFIALFYMFPLQLCHISSSLEGNFFCIPSRELISGLLLDTGVEEGVIMFRAEKKI